MVKEDKTLYELAQEGKLVGRYKELIEKYTHPERKFSECESCFEL